MRRFTLTTWRAKVLGNLRSHQNSYRSQVLHCVHSAKEERNLFISLSYPHSKLFNEGFSFKRTGDRPRVLHHSARIGTCLKKGHNFPSFFERIKRASPSNEET